MDIWETIDQLIAEIELLTGDAQALREQRVELSYDPLGEMEAVGFVAQLADEYLAAGGSADSELAQAARECLGVL